MGKKKHSKKGGKTQEDPSKRKFGNSDTEMSRTHESDNETTYEQPAKGLHSHDTQENDESVLATSRHQENVPTSSRFPLPVSHDDTDNKASRFKHDHEKYPRSKEHQFDDKRRNSNYGSQGTFTSRTHQSGRNYRRNNYDHSPKDFQNIVDTKCKDEQSLNESCEMQTEDLEVREFQSKPSKEKNHDESYQGSPDRKNWRKREDYQRSNKGKWKDQRGNDYMKQKISNHSDPEFAACLEEFHQNVMFHRTVEIEHNLFEMPKDYSLAHCVAEDMNMGSGIAVDFRHKFKRVEQLLNQGQVTGGLAVLEDGGRFIYYLVTKKFSVGKPTNATLFSSLQKLRTHIITKGVTKLAMPRIGCGLDRLEWKEVKVMIEFIFRNVNLEIKICNLTQSEDSSPQKHKSCWVQHEIYPINQIEAGTIILYLSSEHGYISEEMKIIDEKFNFLDKFRSSKKMMGGVIFFNKNHDYLLAGCIVKKNDEDSIDYAEFRNCLRVIQAENKKYNFQYIGMQAFRDPNDSVSCMKVINILKNNVRGFDVYVCWPHNLVNDLLTHSPKSVPEEFRRRTFGATGESGSRSNQFTKWDDHERGSTEKDRRKTTGPLSPKMDEDRWWSEEKNVDKNDDHQKHNSKDSCNNEIKSNVYTPADSDWNLLYSKKNEANDGESDSRMDSSTDWSKQDLDQEVPLNVTNHEFELYEAARDSSELGRVNQEKTLPKSYSRVCYAREDMTMESGIPRGSTVTSYLGQLLDQRKKEGDCALVKDNNDYLFCLMVGRPKAILKSSVVFAAIQKLKSILPPKVYTLVLPKKPDDDSFKWSEIGYMFEYLFRGRSTKIVIDTCPQDSNFMNCFHKSRLKNVKYPINEMKSGSIILYWASEDGYVDDVMKRLERKFHFITDFSREKKILGNVTAYRPSEDFVLCGCIIRKANGKPVDFGALQNCLETVKRNGTFTTVGIQAVDEEDEYFNYKVIAMTLTFLSDHNLIMCWPGKLKEQMPV